MGAFQLIVTSTNLTAIPGSDTPLLAFKFRFGSVVPLTIGLELSQRIESLGGAKAAPKWCPRAQLRLKQWALSGGWMVEKRPLC